MRKELFITEDTFSNFNTGRKGVQKQLKEELVGSSKDEERSIRKEYKGASILSAKEGIEKARVFVKDAHSFANPNAGGRSIAIRSTGTFGLMTLAANLRNLSDCVSGN